VNGAKGIVNAVFTLIGQAMLEAIREFGDWALGMGGSSLNFVMRTSAEATYDRPTVRSLYDFSRGHRQRRPCGRGHVGRRAHHAPGHYLTGERWMGRVAARGERPSWHRLRAMRRRTGRGRSSS
jgi:hypothetical protein